MFSRRYVIIIVIAAVGVIFVAGCGGNTEEFRGTVVAPQKTMLALTSEPATLIAKRPADEERAKPRPATPTPRPPTPTLRPATPTPRPATPTPRPSTPTPQPPTATPRPPTSTPQPTVPRSTVSPDSPETYLGVVQQVGKLGDIWTLSDVRVGMHPGRVRVVWEMAEDRDTVPLTEIMEVDNTETPFPRRGSLLDPSWGEARIDVILSDCYAYEMPLSERLPLEVPGSSLVMKVGLHPIFDDAQLGFSIGLSRPATYEIYTLTDPVRIVIDVIR